MSTSKIRSSQVRLRKPKIAQSPSNRALAQFSLCKNNREYKLQEIVKQFESLKTMSDSRKQIIASNRDLSDVCKNSQGQH